MIFGMVWEINSIHLEEAAMRNKSKAILFILVCLIPNGTLAEPIDIGTRLELLVDNHLIESMEDVEQKLHPPSPREVAIVHDEPWEGNSSGYHTVFRDGDLYRMYYRGHQYRVEEDYFGHARREVICYAESKDGIHWEKPELGLVEFEGSKANNIIWDTIAQIVHWESGSDLSNLKGRTVRIRFVLRDADLYSFQFQNKGP